MSEEPGVEVAVRAPSYQPPAVLSDGEINRMYRVAKALAVSGMFKTVVKAEQAFAKMLIGRELGLSAAQSMQGIHLVKGNLMVAYPMLGQFIRSRPGYDYHVLEHDDEHCVIEFTVDGSSRGTSEFTMADAERANLVKDDGAWKTHPRNLLLARALSNGVKWFVPEVTVGMPVYVEGEIDEPAQLSAGDGDGTPAGIDLPAAVEDVIARAQAIHYLPCAERGVVEIAVGGRAPEYVEQWVAKMIEAMDVFEQYVAEHRDAEDADVIEDDDEPVEA